MSSNQIQIGFRVSGGELASYIKNIQQQSDKLTNDALKSAAAQATAGKEQLTIINQIIAATERKNRIEAQAARSIALEQRETALKKNKDAVIGNTQGVWNDLTSGRITENSAKERITAIEGVGKEKEQYIKSDYRDNLTILRENERQNKILASLSKEQIQTAKDAARDQVKAVQSGDKTLADVFKEVGNNPSEEEKLSLKLIEEQLADEKKKKDKENGGGGIFGSLLAADNIKQIIQTGSQFTKTQSGFDLLQESGSVVGKLVGGILGGIIGSLAGGVGAVAGAGVGAEVVGGLGDAIGSLEQRQAMSKEAFKKSAFRYQAITGGSVDKSSITDMSESGMDFTQFMNLKSEYARRRGYSSDSDKTARDATWADKGLGVDQGTSSALVELQRSFKENNRDLAGLIGGILEKGKTSIFKNGDNTFLNEFISKYATLTKELLKNQTNVSSGLAMDILKQFNGIGGMFSSRDPRSQGIISSIDSSLSNPSSDNGRAIAYRILSKKYPNKGIFDLDEEIGKGLGSPEYLKGIMEFVDQIGGTNQDKMKGLAGYLKGVPLPAVRALWEHRNALRNFDTKELKGIGITEEELKGRSEANTTVLEKNTARIENGILSGTPIKEMADAFTGAVKEAMSGAVIILSNGQGTINFKGAIPKNETYKPTAKEEARMFIPPVF